MSDWSDEIAQATAAAERIQAAEDLAEGRFDAVHAQAHAAGDVEQALQSDELHDWLASRRATDAAWGAWSTVMDSRPHE